MLVSAIHQHEPAVGIHMSPTFWTSLPYPQPSHPSRLSQNHSPSSLGHITNSHWLSILDGNVYIFPYDILNLSHPLLPRGEGNGNPLQCSCLKDPRDGGAWWAAVYGVAQSWTQLKWLSSSSSSLPHCIQKSASPLLLCKKVRQYHLSIFHIYVLIYNVYFPLSDLFHSV